MEICGGQTHTFIKFGIDEFRRGNRTVYQIAVFRPKGVLGGNPAKQFIVPGVGVGDLKLGMSKDEVLKKAGKPGTIFSGSREFTLENLPRRYVLEYDNIEVRIDDNAVQSIWIGTTSYKFANGLGVGDSEEKIKQAFGHLDAVSDVNGSEKFGFSRAGVDLDLVELCVAVSSKS